MFELVYMTQMVSAFELRHISRAWGCVTNEMSPLYSVQKGREKADGGRGAREL